MTFASVFQSSVFISWLRSSSMLVGRTPSQSTRILNFFFTALLRALEFAGEKIIHHQRCDVSGNAKVLLGVIIVRVQAELDIIKPRINVLVELPFARVIRLELYVQAVVIGYAVFRRVHRRLSGKRMH